MAEKPSSRMDRAERLIEALADKQTRLDEVLVTLVDAQIRLTESQDRLTESQDRLTEAQKRQADGLAKAEAAIDRLAEQTTRMSRELDAPIQALVSAIGEMLRTRNGGTQQ